ncbi:MAG: oligosaccharide flippase family protein [Synechococcales cyanobacterium RU_4_20]|nr:oligosaccharide flippase family protein [Synechococcales cyanobacterium RU_4_20]NJR70602.1 oligosaccharide flippase family protein [Synechococcales cyanobacterium CRU_2_2]
MVFGSGDRAWTKQPETLWLVRFLALPLWLEMISDAPAMIMARELQFAEIGVIEVIAQLANYGLSIPLVLAGKGYWAPVLGLTLQQLLNAILFWRAQPIPFRPTWTRACMVPVLRNGIAYTGSDLIISLRALTVPLLVSRLAGVEAVGIISIAIRFAEQLSTLRQVLNQMSLSVLAKFTEQPEKIRNALSQGMVYQVLLVAPACAVFSCAASWLIPLLFGDEWLMSTRIFPLVAMGVMMSATFELHANALYAAAKNREVALFNAGFITLQWSAALVALPILGAWGYGLAELATAPSYGILHYNFSQLYGSPNYKNALTLIAATLPALLAGPWIPVWMGLLLLGGCYGLAIALNPELRDQLQEALSVLKKRRA